MTGIYAAPALASIRTDAPVPEDQLRLPLFREVNGRSGLIITNSSRTERLRRFLQVSLVPGAATEIATGLGARRARIADELEGRVVLSVDTMLGAVSRIGLVQRLRFFASLLAPFGMCPIFRPGAIESIP